jgi:hypothetical protein
VRASRDAAKPLVSDIALKRWAEEQAEIVPNLWSSPEHQAACAQHIRICGGATKRLPIAIHKGRWLSAEEIVGMASLLELAVIVDHFVVSRLKLLASYNLDDTVFMTNASALPGMLQSSSEILWPRKFTSSLLLASAVVEALATAWKVPFDDPVAANPLDQEDDVKIGREGERDIRVRAIKIIRPQAKTSSP